MPLDPANIWAIWYSGAAGRPLTKLRPIADEGVSDLQVELVSTGGSSRTADGSMHTTTVGMYHRVRVIYEQFTSRSTMRQIRTLETHLKRGGLVSFSQDTRNAYAIFSASALQAGSTRIYSLGVGSPFPSGATNAQGVTTAGPDDDDEVVITSGWPESSIEWNTVNAALYDANGNLQFFDLDRDLTYDHTQGPIMVRYHTFYPMMRLAPDTRDQPILVSEHDLTFTLDVTLEEVPASFYAFEGKVPYDVNHRPDPEGPYVLKAPTPRDDALNTLLGWIRGNR